ALAHRFFIARQRWGASPFGHRGGGPLPVRATLRRLFRCAARRGVCGKLTTPRRNLLISTNLAVIGPWFPPPVRVGPRGGGSANVFHQQRLARRRTSYRLRPAQGFILRHAGSAAVARRGADRGGARGLRAAAAAHDEQRQPSGGAGGSPQSGRPASYAGGERETDR